jgi:hypothetical protein
MQMEVFVPTYVASADLVKFQLFGVTYFDLQDIVPTDSLVVHLVIGIICISTAFVLDKGETIAVSR